MENYTDDTIMPSGQHKGKKMSDIPDDYLLFIYNENYFSTNKGLRNYLEENIEAIKNNVKK